MRMESGHDEPRDRLPTLLPDLVDMLRVRPWLGDWWPLSGVLADGVSWGA